MLAPCLRSRAPRRASVAGVLISQGLLPVQLVNRFSRAVGANFEQAVDDIEQFAALTICSTL